MMCRSQDIFVFPSSLIQKTNTDNTIYKPRMSISLHIAIPSPTFRLPYPESQTDSPGDDVMRWCAGGPVRLGRLGGGIPGWPEPSSCPDARLCCRPGGRFCRF